MDTTGPRVAEIESIHTNPRNIVVDSLDVTFSEPIQPESLTLANLKLSQNGGPNLITPVVTLSRLSPTSWHIGNLGLNAGQSGNYEFTVSAQGLRDLAA